MNITKKSGAKREPEEIPDQDDETPSKTTLLSLG